MLTNQQVDCRGKVQTSAYIYSHEIRIRFLVCKTPLLYMSSAFQDENTLRSVADYAEWIPWNCKAKVGNQSKKYDNNVSHFFFIHIYIYVLHIYTEKKYFTWINFFSSKLNSCFGYSVFLSWESGLHWKFKKYLFEYFNLMEKIYSRIKNHNILNRFFIL